MQYLARAISMSERDKLQPFIIHTSSDFEDDKILIDKLFLHLGINKTGTIQKQQVKIGDKITAYNKPIASRFDLTEKAYLNSEEAKHYHAHKAITQNFITGYIVNLIKPEQFDARLLEMINKFYPDEFSLRNLVNSYVVSSDSYDFVAYYLLPESSMMLIEHASSWELETHLDRVVNKIGRSYV